MSQHVVKTRLHVPPPGEGWDIVSIHLDDLGHWCVRVKRREEIENLPAAANCPGMTLQDAMDRALGWAVAQNERERRMANGDTP